MKAHTLGIGFKSLLPCPFTGCKMFCVGPNFLNKPKILTALCASSNIFAPAQKPILLNANHLFVWHKMFVTGVELVSKELNHLATILHVYAGGLNFMK